MTTDTTQGHRPSSKIERNVIILQVNINGIKNKLTEEEYKKGIAKLKNKKVAGIDDVLVEQLNNLGPQAHRWLHSMLNVCFTENRIHKGWRHSKIIAILKPGKDLAIPNNYILISLICNMYKLYERLILNRITLIRKLYNFTEDSPLCRVIQNMLSSRRFYVELNNDRSIWRNQKNGLPRGSVLTPILFNIYTHYQPLHDGTLNFVYADDLCVTAQYPSFTELEHTIEEALGELTTYYRSNSLRANPDKTQVTSFHLKDREAKRMLEVKWNNTDLENIPHPKYLGVSLDRTLIYKKHIHNTKMKVATRNNLMKKLSNSKWGCNASTISTTALALSYSARG